MRDTTALVADANDDVLGRFANRHFDGWRRVRCACTFTQAALNYTLHSIAQKLADDVLHMTENKRKIGVEVTRELDLRQDDVVAVGGAGKGPNSTTAALDDIGGIAFEEDVADELSIGDFDAWVEVGRVEGLCQGKVLLCYDTSGYSLWQDVSDCSR